MNHTNRITSLMLGAALLLPVSGFAQPDNSTEAGLVARTDHGISYVSGGVGDEERAQMVAVRKNYNLALGFATKKTGEYLTDVAVTLKDKHTNTVFDSTALGPLVYLKLPPGQYQVTTKTNGKSQSRAVQVKSNGVTEAFFYWDAEAG